MRLPYLITLVLLFAVACGDDGSGADTDGGGQDGPGGQDGSGQGRNLVWYKSFLDDNRAGKHASIGRSGKVLGVAYFRTLKQKVTVTCPGPTGTKPIKKPRPAQDLYYIRFNGTDWQAPVKVAQTIGDTSGLSIAFGKSSAYIGFLGGGVNDLDCTSSDAVIASSGDGKTWSKSTTDADGNGDTVGHWMSVAVDNNGKVHAAYRDVYNGLMEEIGRTKSSQLYDGAVVVGKNGAGIYSSLAFDPQNRPVIAFYNSTQTDATGGIQLALKKGGWITRQLVAGSTSERLDLETNGKGIFGLAYYSPKDQALFFKESGKDLISGSWSGKQVDTSLTRNGEFPSLAYDSKGNPGISYYRCGKYQQANCDPSKDALMFAYRQGGSWKTHEVDIGGPQRCGTYSSLTFNASDEPVIAYKCVIFDNPSSEYLDALKVAQGEYQ